MIKKFCILLTVIFVYSCGSSSKVRTASSKNTTTKKHTTVKTHTGGTKSGNAGENAKPTEVLEATSKLKVTTEIVNEYISKFKETAKDNMRNHGIPASITLAQGILESGAGVGTLCIKANNHFGIKCHAGWTGESVRHDDDAEQECFRKYSDPAESFRDHSLFLTTRSRYAALFKLPKGDYTAWAKGLKNAGYATDPKYPDKLIGLIERYELYKYDSEVIGAGYNKPVIKKETLIVTNKVAEDGTTYRVSQGDTLYSISKKFNVTVDELIKINNLTSNAISIGQILKVKS